jgi:hypothetical protein
MAANELNLEFSPSIAYAPPEVAGPAPDEVRLSACLSADRDEDASS